MARWRRVDAEGRGAVPWSAACTPIGPNADAKYHERSGKGEHEPKGDEEAVLDMENAHDVQDGHERYGCQGPCDTAQARDSLGMRFRCAVHGLKGPSRGLVWPNEWRISGTSARAKRGARSVRCMRWLAGR